MDKLKAIKDDYLQGDVVMSEMLRSAYNDLSIEDKEELLHWSGDDEYVAVCQWCGEITEFTDDGGRTEKDIGWMCNKCIQAVKSRGEELEFMDEEME